MADFSVVFDPMLDKERAEFDNGSGGSGGSSYVGGERINIAGGTIFFVNSADIVNVTGTSVTLQPDTAYKIYATSQAITLNANPPAAGKWAYEGHLEIFTAGTGYVVTGTNVVLANALEPDSVNNCTVRFHDGIAIIAVEDHVAGYIVVNGSTSGAGSLAYGITTSTNDYVAFDASLNGQAIPLAGAVAEGEKHVVGNGYTETAITGAVDCGTSKFTVANLALSDVQITGGTLTLGDAFIPSGSTVAVSGGGLAVEKVTGTGGVIDLGGTNVSISSGTTVSASGCTITGGSASTAGAAVNCSSAYIALTDCTISGNVAGYGAIACAGFGAIVDLNRCEIYENESGHTKGLYTIFNGRVNVTSSVLHGSAANQCYCDRGAVVTFTDTNCNRVEIGSGGCVIFAGANTIERVMSNGVGGNITIASGAILDLTGNTNATPIAPGGGITFAPGGATVLTGATAGVVDAQYSMYNVTLPAGAKLTNTNVVDFRGGPGITNNANITASASGCTLRGALATTGACDIYGSIAFTDCTIESNYVGSGGSAREIRLATGSASFNGCTIGSGGIIVAETGGAMSFAGNNTILGKGVVAAGTASATVTISSGASINLTNSIINPGGTGGITVLTGGCTVNGNAIPAGTYTSIDSNGQPT